MEIFSLCLLCYVYLFMQGLMWLFHLVQVITHSKNVFIRPFCVVLDKSMKFGSTVLL